MNNFNSNPGVFGNNVMGNFNNPNPMPTSNYFGSMNVNNLPRYNIIQVKGQNGAEALQMAPNSKTILLDETDPLIWFVQTDGAGYKTVTPYTITPYQPAPPVDLNAIEQRLSILEEKINARQSNSQSNKSTKKQFKPQSNAEQPVDTAD